MSSKANAEITALIQYLLFCLVYSDEDMFCFRRLNLNISKSLWLYINSRSPSADYLDASDLISYIDSGMSLFFVFSLKDNFHINRKKFVLKRHKNISSIKQQKLKKHYKIKSKFESVNTKKSNDINKDIFKRLSIREFTAE